MNKEYKEKGAGVKDSPVVLKIKRKNSSAAERLRSYKKPLQKPSSTHNSLARSSSKSADSLDSGIYSRQKSCDSMDSLDSNESGMNGEGASTPSSPGLTPSDEAIPPLPIQQYEDYLREVQDIRQSIIVKSGEETKQPVSRTDSGEDQDDDHEAEWLRMAGLSDLMIAASDTMMTSDDTSSPSRVSTDLSSMTVLSTLTRPQREAVLRRITSFNRAQKTKKRPKPSITSIFPSVDTSPQTTPDHPQELPQELQPPTKKPDELPLKSLSLPREGSFMEGTHQRRYSESQRIQDPPTPVSPTGTPDGSEHSHLKVDYRSKHRKNVDSIVASNLSGGIETLSINPKSESPSWRNSKDEMSMSFTDDPGKIPKSMSYSETAKQDNLPNFSLVRDRLGITKISDLSPVDMRKVQSLALIELTALFDLRNIDLKRKKPAKNKYKEMGVFGTPLTMLVDWDRKRTNIGNLRVPLVLSEIINFLEADALQDEGILRKSGSSARAKALRQDLESRFSSTAPPNAVSRVWQEAHSHDVAALLKQFLRELPDPLLSMEYIEAFQSCGLITDRKEQLQALNLLVILLHEVHRDSLKLLLKFLGQVIANEESNKMSLNNVAMITAPNLFIVGRKNKKDNSTTQDLKHAAGTSNIVRMLIKYHKLLWTVPAFMLTQVRHMNRAELSSKKHHHHPKDKSKYKFFQGGKKDLNKKQPSIQTVPQPFDYDTPKGLIRIQAPNMNLTSMAVQLDSQVTVSDVIAKYQRQCGRMNHKGQDDECEVTNLTHALFEVGGNIHERCLDPDTNMSALFRVNPDANWFLRPRSDG